MGANSHHWHALSPVPTSYLPRQYHDWVLDRGSLTQRLINASHGQFEVELCFQGWGTPTLEEAEALALPRRMQSIIREVKLICQGSPWVVARSIIPASTLSGRERILMHFGNKPLGDFLFRSPSMRRGPLEIKYEQGRLFSPSESLKNYPALAGRRSVFYLHNKPLLVNEFFLPRLFEVCD